MFVGATYRGGDNLLSHTARRPVAPDFRQDPKDRIAAMIVSLSHSDQFDKLFRASL